MQTREAPVRQIRFFTGSSRRDFARKAGAAAAFVAVGGTVVPDIVDEPRAPSTPESRSHLAHQIQQAIDELTPGRVAHAKKTIAALDSRGKTDAQQVDDLLQRVYANHANGMRSRAVIDEFLERLKPWLSTNGITRVDVLFERLDFDRAPESLGILLLATTRLTKAHFTQREAFFARLTFWFIGRNGRTKRDVDDMLKGLRE